MNYFELKLFIASKLNNFYKPSEIETFIKLILQELWNLKPIDFISNEIIFDNSKIKTIEKIIAQLQQYKPIQYILGRTFFYNSYIEVNQNVLIPRPETEELVELILKENKYQHAKILDICTGSGCIAISIAKETQWNVYALDISPKAIEIARKNAKSNNVDIYFYQLDFLKKQLWQIFKQNQFDIIVSNPPYVLQSQKKQMHTNVLNYEPHLALFVDDNQPLIFYQAIAQFAIEYLTKNGTIYAEINENLGQKTAQLFKNNGFKNVEVLKDIRQKDRFIRAKF